MNLRHCLGFACAFSITAFAAAQTGEPQPAEPQREARSLGLKALPPLTAPVGKLRDLAARYPQFQHVPFNESGINPLILPFRDESGDAASASEISLAFSFLLSWDMDFAPENFCSRHAYFIFKRSDQQCRALLRRYDTRLVGELMDEWRSTHAIGGGIRKTDKGYTGSLVVYGKAGVAITTETFDTPRPYHELLGDVAVAAMKALGSNPRPEVVEHLHKPRFTNDESISLLGRAALASERSDEEFGLYDKILKQDPGFAEVRYWYANQSYWETRDRQKLSDEVIEALQSRLIPAAMTDFPTNAKTPATVLDQFREWTDRGERIMGPDAPAVLKNRLNLAEARRERAPELLARALKVCSALPNDGHLLDATAQTIGRAPGNFDAEMAISILLAKLQSKFIVATGHEWEAGTIMEHALRLGRPADALAMLRSIENPKDWQVDLIVETFMQLGYFDLVIQYYPRCERAMNTRNNLVNNMALAAFITGNAPLLQQIIEKHQPVLKRTKTLLLIENCLATLQNQPTQPPPAEVQGVDFDTYAIVAELQCHYNLVYGDRRQFAVLAHKAAAFRPDNRLLWFLADAYLQENPNPKSAPFYDALEFLHGDDLWVAGAVARFRKLNFPVLPEQAWETHPLLQQAAATAEPTFDGEPVKPTVVVHALSPWGVAARVRQLLEAGHQDQALTLARKYRQLAVQTEFPAMIAFARDLARRAETWRK